MKLKLFVRIAPVLIAAFICSISLAQSVGESVYKSKCLMCHGVSGAAETVVAKTMKVKPASDPEVKRLSAEAMFVSVKNGKGKMASFKDKLTDEQIKSSVAYYRSFLK